MQVDSSSSLAGSAVAAALIEEREVRASTDLLLPSPTLLFFLFLLDLEEYLLFFDLFDRADLFDL